MKTVQIPTVFMNTAKNNRKSFIFVNCLRFSRKLLSRLSQKVIKIIFLDGKEDKEKQHYIFSNF